MPGYHRPPTRAGLARLLAEAEREGRPVLLLFTEKDCPACPFARILAELASAALDVAEIDLSNDELAPLAVDYGVTAVPQFVLLIPPREARRRGWPHLIRYRVSEIWPSYPDKEV